MKNTLTYDVNKYGHILIKCGKKELYLQSDYDVLSFADSLGLINIEENNDNDIAWGEQIDEAYNVLNHHEGEEFEDVGYFE